MQLASQFARQASRAKPSKLGRQGASGYSLVELLMVVAILLVILAIAMPRLMAARTSAQQASAVVFLRNLHAAQEQFYMVHGHYAATFAELEGFLASNGGALTLRPQFPGVGAPMFAMFLMPAPDGDGYSGTGPARPTGTDQHSSGGGAPMGAGPGGGGSNPPSQGSDEGSPAGGGSPGSGSQGGPEQSSGGSGSGSGSGEPQGGNWSKADRMTYQGYEFFLLRPTAHTWNCLAMPVRDERNGHHYFADQSGAIRREFGRPASAQSPAL